MRLAVSVVVPTYRRPELLERCLEALADQDLDPAGYEIIVVDDGPEAATRGQVERWAARCRGRPMMLYVPVTGTQGPAGARNRGWEAAEGEVIAFTDDDTVPHADWLSAGLRAMEPDVVAAAGRVVVPLPADRAPTDHERDIARMERCEFVTANCFVRRDALAAVGGFDERFTAAWREDSDLHFSLLALPGRVACAPEAAVEHPVRPVDDWTDGIRQHRKIAFDALLYKKHPRLYRERIRRLPPLDYYGIVLALVTLAAGAVLRAPALALAGFAAWALFTGLFLVRRMKGTSLAPSHVAGLVATSIVIPLVAVYWRLAGAFRYRVVFL
ncbi:MAG: glycosyltransferase family 2 protein [Gemmatimonadaceae bacterium]